MPEPAAREPAPEPPPVVTARPLVGRKGELRTLVSEHEACETDGRLVVIEGEAGVGKTRLGEELVDAARAAGKVAVAARSHEGEAGIGFGLVAAALRAALDAAGEGPLAQIPPHWRAEAARLVPEVASRDAVAAATASPPSSACTRGSPTCSPAWSPGPPGVLFLDDLQLANPASLGVIGYLVRRLAGRPMLVVAAWRAEEIGADHAVLRRSAHRVIRPGRLSREDVAELAAAAGLEERAPHVFDETEGLPLFVVEYLAAVGGTAEDGDLPGGVRELLAARLDGIGEAATQLLTAAAVIGRSFDVDVLARPRDAARTRPRQASRSSRGAGFSWSASGATSSRTTSCWRSPTSARASRADRLLHRRVAEGLAAGHGDPALMARHLLAAGLEPDAADAFRTARRPGPGGLRLSRGARGVSLRDRAWAPGAVAAARGGRRPPHAHGRVRRGDLGIRGGRGAWRPRPLSRASSTSSAACTTAVATPSWPSAICSRRCGSAASRRRCRPTAAWRRTGGGTAPWRSSSPGGRWSSPRRPATPRPSPRRATSSGC